MFSLKDQQQVKNVHSALGVLANAFRKEKWIKAWRWKVINRTVSIQGPNVCLGREFQVPTKTKTPTTKGTK